MATALSAKIDISVSSGYSNAPGPDPTLVSGDVPLDQITILKNLAIFSSTGTTTGLAARHFAEKVVNHSGAKTYGATVTDVFGNVTQNISPFKAVYVVNNDATNAISLSGTNWPTGSANQTWNIPPGATLLLVNPNGNSGSTAVTVTPVAGNLNCDVVLIGATS